MFKSPSRGMVPLVILLVTAVFITAMFLLRPKTAPTQTGRIAPRVRVITLSQEKIAPVLELYGTVESPQRVAIKAPTTTYVIATPVLEGDTVVRGQKLLELDLRDPTLAKQTREGEVKELEAQIASEKTRYDADLESLEDEKELVRLKKKTVEREEYLLKTRVGSAQRKEEAEQALRTQELSLTNRELAVADHINRLNSLNARLIRAKALLEQAELDLTRAAMLAPFDGRVIALNVAVGDRVIQGQEVLSLFDTTEVEIRAQIPHNNIAYLNRVLNKEKQLKAWTKVHGQSLKLKLDRLSGEINARRAGVDALFSIDEGDAVIPLGQTVPIYLQLSLRDDLFALPITAIYDEQRVYRVVDSKLERVIIDRVGYTLTDNDQRLALVRSKALKAGDVIMINQLQQIADGMAVEVTHPPQTDKDDVDASEPPTTTKP